MSERIIFRPMGGLGNQLFQFAAAYSEARRTAAALHVNLYGIEQLSRGKRPGRRAEYLLQPLHELIPVSTVSGNLMRLISYHGARPLNTYLCHMLAWASSTLSLDHQIILETKEPTYDLNRIQGTNCTSKSLVGNWQHSNFFVSREGEILELLRHPKLVELVGDSLLDRASEAGVTGVHVRLGDFVGSAKMRNLTSDYYQNALDLVRSANDPKSKVLVFSDDPHGARSMFKAISHENLSFVEEKDASGPLGHLIALSLCSKLVIANSTFSWWAAKVAGSRGARILAPREWYIDGRANELNKPLEWTLLP